MQSAHSFDTARGYLMIMLHAHLPYIRYPEHENFLEENWLYETMTETYIPVINILENLIDDGVDFRLSLSLSPPLIEMLSDDLLMSRYQRYLCKLIELSEISQTCITRDFSGQSTFLRTYTEETLYQPSEN